MKNILFIIENFSPSPSSVANCMQPYIDKLAEEYNIDVITDRKRTDISEIDTKNNVTVHRVSNYRIMNTMHLSDLQAIDSSKLLKFVTKIFVFILKALYYARYALFAKERKNSGWDGKLVVNKIEELNHTKKYDAMFSASAPFRSHYIAEKIKDSCPYLKWYAFQFDPYSYNKGYSVNYFARRIMMRDEKRIFNKCDGVFLTLELFDYYKSVNFVNLNKNVIPLPYANFKKIQYDEYNVDGNFVKSEKISCLFIGQIYDKIRNPEVMIRMFSKISSDVQLFLMTNTSEEKIKKYSLVNYIPTMIPYQNHDTALYNLLQANILVNIGNTVEHQMPAKIFEYMSTGKPIIHFSKIRNDPALRYLSCYPRVFVINEWERGFSQTEQLKEFCLRNHNFELTYEEISKLMSEYSNENILGLFVEYIQSVDIDS